MHEGRETVIMERTQKAMDQKDGRLFSFQIMSQGRWAGSEQQNHAMTQADNCSAMFPCSLQGHAGKGKSRSVQAGFSSHASEVDGTHVSPAPVPPRRTWVSDLVQFKAGRKMSSAQMPVKWIEDQYWWAAARLDLSLWRVFIFYLSYIMCSIKTDKNSIIIGPYFQMPPHLFLWMFNKNSTFFKNLKSGSRHRSQTHRTPIGRSNLFVRKKWSSHPEQTEGPSHLAANAGCFSERNKPPITHLISQYYPMGEGGYLPDPSGEQLLPEAGRLTAAVIVS